MSAPTVPALVLDLLGGMRGYDDSVQYTYGEGVLWSTHPDGDGWPDDWGDSRLRVKQSRGALLSVLARHLGWQGNQRPVMRVVRHQPAFVPNWRIWKQSKHHGPGHVGKLWCVDLPAHISTDLSYHEALAAAVCWFARVERIRIAHGGVLVWGPGEDRPTALAASERRQELPPLEVTTL